MAVRPSQTYGPLHTAMVQCRRPDPYACHARITLDGQHRVHAYSVKSNDKMTAFLYPMTVISGDISRYSLRGN